MLERRRVAGWVLVAAIVVGCDDKPAPAKTTEPALAVTTQVSAAPKPPPDPLEGLVVDDLGLYLQTHRIDMTAKDAETKLRTIVAELPVKQKTVPIRASRNAKTQHLGVLARALGEA